MDDIRIYLAYSTEDAPYDRDALGNGIRALNDLIRQTGGKHLRLTECEDASPAEADPHLVVSLSVRHGGGKELLQKILSTSGEVPGILTFFRANGDHAPSYQEMMDWVDEKLHYRTEYDHISQVREQLILHLLRFQPFEYSLDGSKIVVGSQTLIPLDTSFMLTNTPQFQALCKKLADADERRLHLKGADPTFATNPDYLAAQKAWEEAQKEKEQYLREVYNYWAQASRAPTLRQQMADAAVLRGDLNAALRILDLDELELEYEQEMHLEAIEAQLRRRKKQQRVEEVLHNIRLQLQKYDDPQRFEKAKRGFELACRMEEENNLPRKALKAYADHLLCQAEPQAAIGKVLDALSFAEKTDDLKEQASLHHMLANCYENIPQQSDAAMDSYDAAIRIWGALSASNDLHARIQYIDTQLHKAEYLIKCARTGEARDILQKMAHESNLLPADHPGKAFLMETLFEALADLYRKQGDYTNAADAYGLALEIRLRRFAGDDPFPLALAMRYADRCAMCLYADPPTDALRFQAKRDLRRLQELLPDLEEPDSIAMVKLRCDILHYQCLLAVKYEKDLPKGIRLLQEALDIIQAEDKLTHSRLELLMGLGDILVKQKDVDAASDAYGQAALLISAHFMGENGVPTTPLGHFLAFGYRDLGRLPGKENDPALHQQAAHWLWLAVQYDLASLARHCDGDLSAFSTSLSGLAWSLRVTRDLQMTELAYDAMTEVISLTGLPGEEDVSTTATLHYARSILARILELHQEVAPELAQWLELRLEDGPDLSDDGASVMLTLSLEAADSAMKVKKPAEAVRVLKCCKDMLLNNSHLSNIQSMVSTVCAALAKAYEKDKKPALAKKERDIAARLRK